MTEGVFLNLSQLATMALVGLVAVLFRRLLKAQDDQTAKSDKQHRDLTDQIQAMGQRWDDRRDLCRAEADGKYARAKDVDEFHRHVDKNLGVIYGRVREVEVTALEAKNYARGINDALGAKK